MAAADTAKTEFNDTDCRFCTHSGDAHDAGECWAEKDGAQCQCWWYTPAEDVATAPAQIARHLYTAPPKES
jgi:hypothetical protein